MPDTYAGDPGNNPSSITLPANGDPPGVETLNPAFRGLMDKIAFVLAGIGVTFEGRKLFADFVEFEFGIQIGALGDEAEYDAAIAIHDVPNLRKPLLQFKLGPTYWGRLYAREAVGLQNGGLEFTVNARWTDNDEWEPDLVTGSSKVVELFGGFHGFTENDDTQLVIRRKSYAERPPESSQLTFAAASDTITRIGGSWIVAGFKEGQTIRIAGTGSNDGTHKVTHVTTLVLTVGNTLVNETITDLGITIRTYPWAVDEWDPGTIGFATGNPAKTDTIPRNVVFAKGMPVAWGLISVDGAGNVTIEDSYNINATAIVGDAVRITLHRSMANADYCVNAHSATLSKPLMCHEIVSSLEFDIAWRKSDHTAWDPALITARAGFSVFGEVSDNVT